MEYINANENFGTNLKRKLLEKNISMSEFARQIGVSKSTVSGWIAGTKAPRMGKVDIVCKYFNCTVSEMVEGVSSETLDAFEEDIIKRFRKLDNTKKITAYKTFDEILKALEA